MRPKTRGGPERGGSRGVCFRHGRGHQAMGGLQREGAWASCPRDLSEKPMSTLWTGQHPDVPHGLASRGSRWRGAAELVRGPKQRRGSVLLRPTAASGSWLSGPVLGGQLHPSAWRGQAFPQAFRSLRHRRGGLGGTRGQGSRGGTQCEMSLSSPPTQALGPSSLAA